MRQVKIEASWKDQLAAEFAADYMAELSQFLRDEKAAGKRIYPPNSEIFVAFDMTPFAKVKVVILGQDPITDRVRHMASAFQFARISRRHHPWRTSIGKWPVI